LCLSLLSQCNSGRPLKLFLDLPRVPYGPPPFLPVPLFRKTVVCAPLPSPLRVFFPWHIYSPLSSDHDFPSFLGTHHDPPFLQWIVWFTSPLVPFILIADLFLTLTRSPRWFPLSPGFPFYFFLSPPLPTAPSFLVGLVERLTLVLGRTLQSPPSHVPSRCTLKNGLPPPLACLVSPWL